MKDRFNIPCWGCKHEGDYCFNEWAIRWGTLIDQDYMFEPNDCKGYTLIDAGIIKSEALGMKLFKEE